MSDPANSGVVVDHIDSNLGTQSCSGVRIEDNSYFQAFLAFWKLNGGDIVVVLQMGRELLNVLEWFIQGVCVAGRSKLYDLLNFLPSEVFHCPPVQAVIAPHLELVDS